MAPPPVNTTFLSYSSLFTKLVAYIYKYTKINNKINNTVDYKEYTKNLTKYYITVI